MAEPNRYAVIRMEDVFASTSAEDPLAERLGRYMSGQFTDDEDFTPLDRPGFLETLVDMAPTDRSVVLVGENAVNVRGMLGSMKWRLGPHSYDQRHSSDSAFQVWMYTGVPIRGTQTPDTNRVAVRTVKQVDSSVSYGDIFVVTPQRRGEGHHISLDEAEKLGKNLRYQDSVPYTNGSSSESQL